MIAEHLWGALGVEAAAGVRAVLREALDDGGLASVGVVTSRLPGTALPAGIAAGSTLAVDSALVDVEPITYRNNADPNDVRVIGVTYSFLISLEQAPHGDSDDLVIRAFGAIVLRLSVRRVRTFVSPVIGGLGALLFDRAAVSLTEQAAVFSASGHPFARALLYRVRVTRGIGEPDVAVPAEILPPVAWNGPRRFVVVKGGSPHVRRAVAEAIAGAATIAHVDLAQVESPWIEESAQQLSVALDAASAAGAVLLFDEADALFGKRTELTEAHDRYAAVIVTTADDDLAKRLERRGAEVVDAGDGEPHP